jgi:uncharacterized membrane protein YfcA
MPALTFIFGVVVGFSLGLTGGGGAIFAVPLLIYGLGLSSRAAVGISMMTVGVTAFAGFMQRMRRHQVEFKTGILFAAAGISGAPIGTWLAARISDHVLLGMFSLLMIVIAARMWMNAGTTSQQALLDDDDSGPTCQRDPEGKLTITTDCGLLLAGVGLLAGALTGLFGVGGGFIIVPALVTFSGMGIQRAIGTSLLVISLVSISGTASHLMVNASLPIATSVIFVSGSIAGLFTGSRLSRGFSGPGLQKLFAAAIVLIAVYVVIRSQWISS